MSYISATRTFFKSSFQPAANSTLNFFCFLSFFWLFPSGFTTANHLNTEHQPKKESFYEKFTINGSFICKEKQYWQVSMKRTVLHHMMFIFHQSLKYNKSNFSLCKMAQNLFYALLCSEFSGFSQVKYRFKTEPWGKLKLPVCFRLAFPILSVQHVLYCFLLHIFARFPRLCLGFCCRWQPLPPSTAPTALWPA